MRKYFSILVIVGGVAVVFFLWHGRPQQDSKINKMDELTSNIEEQSKDVNLDSNTETNQLQFEVSGTSIPNLQTNEEYVTGESLRFCFEAADYSGRPELYNPTNKAALWQWKINPPWVAYLDRGGVSRLRRSVTSANFYSAAKEAKARDINNGDNIEIWEGLEKLKAQSEHLNVGLSHEEVLNIFGNPTSLANYHFETNATEGHLVMTIQKSSFTTNSLNEFEGPYSIYYEPPGWEERGGNYFFRRLAVDFTAEGRIYQWYFDPIPLSSDW